ncbi:hypothetical protein VC83_05340 [Pseudogymnoascus destructans]|uniref:Uncharacterized protein n=2 Tax=Pseudogymnoascus destructans TaxID=655981 RepID=L8FZV4_PSED2|nr:uncharacterized protein VC83_05340 [Pseudogymnoascus destructans]ELR06402.1 hypothetical protein GMDG_02119 [Pseudogymnoascus destructans 20631-21]OAF57960.1 hypothetical protein VC83_05340 [Pseudogymnoascus destructans]
MQLSLYSISVGLSLFHSALGGSLEFEPAKGTPGDTVTCTSKEFDDQSLAGFLEAEEIDDCTRVGNNFVFDDGFIFRCGDSLENEILTVCQGPIGGESTCKPTLARAGVDL